MSEAPASPALASTNAHAPDPMQDSADLGREIERVQADMERSIQIAGLKNDPVLPLIRVAVVVAHLAMAAARPSRQIFSGDQRPA